MNTNSKILIVEDEGIVAQDIRKTLKSLGYSVTGIARSGEAALEKIKETMPDLVLMDIHLAGQMDGVQTAGRIHVLHNIPVIYLTAYADKELHYRAKVTEPYGYIIKPFDERELHTLIEMALYKHRMDREMRKREAVLFTVISAAEWLLSLTQTASSGAPKPRDVDASDIRDILEPVGLALEAGAIGIFKTVPGPDGTERMSMTYEWGAPDLGFSLRKPELEQFSFSGLGLSRWQELLAKGEAVSATLSTLPESEKTLFSLLGVKSGALFPVFIRERFWGFVGFFDPEEKIRSPDEMVVLRVTANLLGAVMGYR
jgi:CheY-like chemotaxis protein